MQDHNTCVARGTCNLDYLVEAVRVSVIAGHKCAGGGFAVPRQIPAPDQLRRSSSTANDQNPECTGHELQHLFTRLREDNPHNPPASSEQLWIDCRCLRSP